MARLTAVQREAAEKKLRAGVADNEIAREYGVHPSTIGRLKRRLRDMANDEAGAIMVGLRLSREEEAQLKGRVARSEHHTKSSFLREVARVALDFPELNDSEEAEIRRIDSNLMRVGGNLNQIAKALSTEARRNGKADLHGKRVGELEELTNAVRDQLKELRQFQNALLRRCQQRTSSLLAQAGV